jgi:hypothetical protein
MTASKLPNSSRYSNIIFSRYERTLPARHTMRPPPSPHTLLDGSPNALDDLSIAPSTLLTLTSSPLLNLYTLDHATPSLDRIRHLFTSPANIDAEGVGKQLRCIGPLVALKLPGLTRCEDGNNPLPIVGLELIGGVDEDEAQRALGIDGPHWPLGVQDVCADAGAVGWNVDAALKELLDVGHAEEGGGGGGEEDDGLEAATRGGRFAPSNRHQGWVSGGGGRWSGRVGTRGRTLAADEKFGLFADGGEVLRVQG